MSLVLPTTVFVLVLALAGCDVERDDNENGADAKRVQDATIIHPSREYQGTGQLVLIKAETAELVIEHAPIPGLDLPSDRTQFLVAKPEEINDLHPGDRVHFVLIRDNKGRFVIRGIWQE